MSFHFKGKKIEALSDKALEAAIAETEADIEARWVALNGDVAEDVKHIELQDLLSSLGEETQFRLEARADKAENKLAEIWKQRGLDPEQMYKTSENGDQVLSDEAQDIFNQHY